MSMRPAVQAVRGSRQPERPHNDELLLLARSAASGDSDGITTLVMAVGGSMLRTVRKVLGSSHPDVDDVTQDAIVAMLGNLGSFREECSVQHFANRVALFTALAARRRMRVRNRYYGGSKATERYVDTREPGPFDVATSVRWRELVLEVLERVPEPIVDALALHFILGYTVEEIAASSGVPQNTVWSRLRLGKLALRRAITNDLRLGELSGRRT